MHRMVFGVDVRYFPQSRAGKPVRRLRSVRPQQNAFMQAFMRRLLKPDHIRVQLYDLLVEVVQTLQRGYQIILARDRGLALTPIISFEGTCSSCLAGTT